jgi:Fe-S oxidoreductase
VVTANPGCSIQLERGLRLKGIKAKVPHVVELLDEAYGREEGAGLAATGTGLERY